MIRYAIGGIIKLDDSLLLVKKGKIMDAKKTIEVKSEWDFPKGGIKKEDLDIQSALFREIHEETGAKDFRIIGELGTLEFEFPVSLKERLGFERQVTHMFLLEFFGDRDQLKPKTEEISEVTFVKFDKVAERLKLSETREFFQDHLDEIKLGVVLKQKMD